MKNSKWIFIDGTSDETSREKKNDAECMLVVEKDTNRRNFVDLLFYRRNIHVTDSNPY